MINRVILIGRLVRDPELRYTANGVAMASFTIAVDRNFVNQQGERGADFIRIAVWRKLAETCANHLSKGRLIAVDGRLQVRSFEGQDGQKRTIAEVVAEDVRFLDWNKDGQGGGPAKQQESGEMTPGADTSDDDLPF